MIIIDLSTFYTDTAKLSSREAYLTKAYEQAGEGNEVVLTGKAPVWL